MGPTNVFDRVKKITPVVLSFFERFSFRISYLKDVELNNFGYLSYMFLQGICLRKNRL